MRTSHGGGHHATCLDVEEVEGATTGSTVAAQVEALRTLRENRSARQHAAAPALRRSPSLAEHAQVLRRRA